jgi:hypothetical protein
MKWVRERRSNTEPEKREGWLANTARTPGEVDGAGHGERIPLSRRALSLFILQGPGDLGLCAPSSSLESDLLESGGFNYSTLCLSHTGCIFSQVGIMALSGAGD